MPRSGNLYGYYHCQPGCKERQKIEEVNNDFIEYLKSFEVDEDIMNLYYLILEDVFNKDKVEKEAEKKHLIALIESSNKKLDLLTDKYLEDLIGQDDYLRNKQRFEDEINKFQQQTVEMEFEKRDFIMQIQYSFGLLKNISDYYKNATIEIKHKLIGSIFPDKLLYENKNYRTTKINSLIPLIFTNINDFGEIKKKRIVKKNNPSHMVAP